MIKIAVIHAPYLPVPDNAQPGNAGYRDANALDYVNSNIEKTLSKIEEAGKNGADICCTHEDFVNSGGYGWYIVDRPDLYPYLVEQTFGEVRKLFGAAAKKYSMMIAANNYESDGGKIYNTSTLYGRDGSIIGRYRKVHLPAGERWHVTAGSEFPVFKTDIGNIGFMTCYDVFFPETCRILALNGADIVIHQTQGWGLNGKEKDGMGGIVGEAFMRVRSSENSVYLVTSKVIQDNGKDGGRSVVTDNCGRILADSGPDEEKIIYAEFEPDFNITDRYAYNSFFSGIPEVRAQYALSRRPETYAAFTDKNPEVLNRFPGMRFMDRPGEPEKIIKFQQTITEEERRKYHW